MYSEIEDPMRKKCKRFKTFNPEQFKRLYIPLPGKEGGFERG
jgi:hypothetical protein